MLEPWCAPLSPRCRRLIKYVLQINIAAFVTDPEQTGPDSYVPPPVLSKQSASREELLKAYEGWGPEMTNLLSCVEETAKWDIDVVYPPIEAEGWAKGSVAILGDAVSDMVHLHTYSR